MNSAARFTVVALFLSGVLFAGILGGATEMTFIWPSYLIIALAGVVSVSAVFSETRFVIPGWRLVAVFAAAAYFLLRASDSPAAYFARGDGGLIISCLITYAVFISVMDAPRWRRGFLWVFTVLIGLNSFAALVEWITGSRFGILPDRQPSGGSFVSGLFNHSEHLAGFLAMGICFLAAIILFGGFSNRIRIGLSVLGALSLLAIFASASLLGVISLGAGLTVLGVFAVSICWHEIGNATRTKLVWGIAGFIVIASAILTARSSQVEELVFEKILTRDEGRIELLNTWKASWEQISSAPLAGTGSRTFWSSDQAYLTPAEFGFTLREPQFAYNEILQILGDYGILGLIVVLTILFLHLGAGIRFVMGYSKFDSAADSLFPKSQHLALVAGAIAAMTSVLILACFDFVLHLPAFAVVASAFLGVLACPDPMSKATADEEENYLPGGGLLFAGRSLTFGCGVAMTFFSFVFSQTEWKLELARLSLESGKVDSNHFRNLARAGRIDPINPHVPSLRARSFIQAIRPEMSEPVQIACLEKAGLCLAKARTLYPKDVYGALEHGIVLGSLGRWKEAQDCLDEIRRWVPNYEDLLIAHAVRHFRGGKFDQAEAAFLLARQSDDISKIAVADRGLVFISKRRGNRDSTGKESHIAARSVRNLKIARIDEMELSGEAAAAIEKSIRELEEKLDAQLGLIFPHKSGF